MENLWNMKVIVIAIAMCSELSKKYWKEIRGIGKLRKNGNHPDHSIAKISLHTEKSPEHLRILAVT